MISTIVPVLRDRRLALGLSQQQVAERADMSQAYYSKLELGKREPRAGTLEELARALSLELMLVPIELVPAVNAMTGREAAPEERPLFAATGD